MKILTQFDGWALIALFFVVMSAHRALSEKENTDESRIFGGRTFCPMVTNSLFDGSNVGMGAFHVYGSGKSVHARLRRNVLVHRPECSHDGTVRILCKQDAQATPRWLDFQRLYP